MKNLIALGLSVLLLLAACSRNQQVGGEGFVQVSVGS